MMMSNQSYVRPQASDLCRRLEEPRRFIQIVTGARQVGKTTLVSQVAEQAGLPHRYASADEPTLRGPGWIAQQWDIARIDADRAGAGGALLILDEVQKASGWAESVKRLWDEDTLAGRELRVVLSGSAQLLIGRGLTESLAGRFEIVHLPHWSYREMRSVFGWSLHEYLFHGAYPGSAPLVSQPDRWSRYIRDSLIETAISRDVLLLSRVDKPVLLRRLFELACDYSGQILSYTKMLGQLQEAGNTTTLAHYLDLFSAAGMVTGLQKYSGEGVKRRGGGVKRRGGGVKRRGSSPKLQVFNTALMAAMSDLTLEQAREDRSFWGRLVESAVGAHLVNAAAGGRCEVFYWRDRNREVDFVVRAGGRLTAIEVKSGRASATPPGMLAFTRMFNPDRTLHVGDDGVSVEDFLSVPVEYWVGP